MRSILSFVQWDGSVIEIRTPVAHDELLLRQICSESEKGQEKVIGIAGYVPIMSYGQTEFVKEGVAVEVQFGQYPFAAYDLFCQAFEPLYLRCH